MLLLLPVSVEPQTAIHVALYVTWRAAQAGVLFRSAATLPVIEVITSLNLTLIAYVFVC